MPWYVVVGQLVQEDAAAAAEYLPTAQFVHIVAAVSVVDAASDEYLPAAQYGQRQAPAPE